MNINNNILVTLKTFFQRRKTLFFAITAGGILLLIILTIIIMYFTSQDKQPPSNQTVIPSPSSSSTNTRTNISSLQKTQIGKTSQKEIENNQQVKKKEILPDGRVKYTVSSSIPSREDEVFVKNGVVVFESTTIFTTRYGPLPRISIYTKQFGEPQQVIDGNKLYGWFTSSYIFPDNGVVLIANRFTKEVYEIIRFTPMPLDQFKKQYAEYLIVVKNEGEVLVPR